MQEYREGDYLTVHSDMRPGDESTGAGGSRRLTFVLSLSSGEWPAECGGRFVWCRPAAAVTPTSNSLTLFATSPWSKHLVEPVWSGRGCGDNDNHRFAWSGWYSTPSSEPSARSAAQAAEAELAWLRQQIAAQLRWRSADAAMQRGLLVEPRSTGTELET